MSINFALEYVGFYKSYKFCIVLRSTGYRCAYIKVPDNVTLPYSKDLDNPIACIYPDFLVHGGITFDENVTNYLDLDCDLFDGECHILGFDCGHAGDMQDIEKMQQYLNEGIFDIEDIQFANALTFEDGYSGATIKDVTYCIKECETLIEEIKYYNYISRKE